MKDHHAEEEKGNDPPWVISMDQPTQHCSQTSHIGGRTHSNNAPKVLDVATTLFGGECHGASDASTEEIAVVIKVSHAALTNVAMKIFCCIG